MLSDESVVRLAELHSARAWR